MKPKHLLRMAFLLLLSFNFINAFAILPGGNVMGQVIDPNTKQPIPNATVVFDCQGTQTSVTANENGFYYASNIPPCTYTITALFLSNRTIMDEVKVLNGSDITLNMELAVADVTIGGDSGIIINGGKVRKVLLDPIDPTSSILLAGDLDDMPIITTTDIEEFQVGVVKVGGESYVHGARAGGLVYYIDDCRVMGLPTIPLSGVEMYRSYTGFLPARYGDTTGGAIVIETKSYFAQ